MRQTLMLTSTIAMGMAGRSVVLAAAVRKANWGQGAWLMLLLFLELFRTLCCFVMYRIFDELEGQSNDMLYAVLLLMAGGGILSIVVEFLQIADFVKNEGRRTTKRTAERCSVF